MYSPHNSHNSQPPVQKAIEFFQQAHLIRLLDRLREKYVELGHVGGQIVLEESSAEERRNLASLLGKPAYRNTTLRIRLLDVDTALRQSGFACTLPELLAAFFSEELLLTRPIQRATRRAQQEGFHGALTTIVQSIPEGTAGHRWLCEGLHGLEWLYTRAKNTSSEEQARQLAITRYVAEALNQLPQAGMTERLALFAQRTSGDPHALDSTTVAGRLFLLALADLAQIATDIKTTVGTEVSHPFTPSEYDSSAMTETTKQRGMRHREQELQLYLSANLLTDTISSTVAVCNLKQALTVDNTPDALLAAAGTRILVLPLRQLLDWRAVYPTCADIYLVENPQVFEEIVAALATSEAAFLPTVICTAGWPSVAALTLLDLLTVKMPDCHLHYSGDFDLKGLQIATSLLTRYPQQCDLWRFDSASYQQALQHGGNPAPANDLATLQSLPVLFKSLITTIQEQAMWAYQEGITQLLRDDILGV